MIQFDFDIIGFIVAISAASLFIHKKYLKPRNELIKSAIESHAKIAKIYSEMYPNGGSSVRDQLVRIENGLVSVSQRQHAYLLEHELGVFQSDENGDCIEVNRTYCRISDRTESECLGSGWIHAIHHEDRESVSDEWSDSVKGKRDFKMTYRIVQPDGEVKKVFSSAHPMINTYNKKLIGFMGTVKVLA